MHDICGELTRGGPSALAPIAAHYEAETLACGRAMFGARARGATQAGGLWQGDGILVVADARLDDRARLLADLALSDPQDDARLIAAAWRHWGEDCPRHLIGDYAFAVHDLSQGRLFCARDHIGARPFFYAHLDGGIVFASDPDALLQAPRIPRDLDEEAVARALAHPMASFHGASFHKAVRRLGAGHSLSVDEGGVRTRRYWRPQDAPPVRLDDDAACVRAGRALVSAAVRDRLAGPGGVGVHLSGGIDSSLVAAIAVEALRADGRPDPIGYAWQALDPAATRGETACIEAIRARLGIEARAPLATPEGIADLLARDWTRGPDAKHLLHEAPVQRDAAASGVRVMLTGFGGDEAISFDGRGHLADLLRGGRLAALARQAPPFALRRQMGNLRKAVRGLLGRDAMGPVDPARLSERDVFAADLGRVRAQARPAHVRVTGVRRTQFDILEMGTLTARAEDWAISGRRLGIEYRHPLLDRRVMEFAYGVPTHLFRRGGTRRWLMRAIAEGLVPDAVRLGDVKTEPRRIAALEEALGEAMVLAGERLRAMDAPPARARFVAMDRLHARIDEIRRGEASARDQPLRCALQFLDFE